MCVLCTNDCDEVTLQGCRVVSVSRRVPYGSFHLAWREQKQVWPRLRARAHMLSATPSRYCAYRDAACLHPFIIVISNEYRPSKHTRMAAQV